MLTLYEIADTINDSCVVDVYSATTNDLIATYDGKENIPEHFMDCDVTDLFVDNNKLCVEIDDSEFIEEEDD